MAGTHRSQKRATATTKRKTGARRAKPQRAGAYAWLGAGAITLGVGAALATGSGIAHADDTGSDTSSSPGSSRADGSPSGAGSTSVDSGPRATKPADSTGSAGSAHGAESTADHTTRHTSPPSTVSSSGGSVSSATTTSSGSSSALSRQSGSTATKKSGRSRTGTAAMTAGVVAHRGPTSTDRSIVGSRTTGVDAGTAEAQTDRGAAAITPTVATKTVAVPSITQIATASATPTLLASTNPTGPLALPQLAELASAAIRRFENSPFVPASAAPRTVATSQTLAVETVAAPVAQSTPPSLTEMLQHAFFNKVPTGNPAQAPGESATGVVSGDLNASDPDGDELTYTITQQPAHGSVVVNPDGSYTYTPDTDLANSGGTDHFTVSVDDGAGYRTTDTGGAILGLFHSLAQAIGLSGPDTTTVTVPVSITATNEPPTITGDTKTSTDASGVVTGRVTAIDSNNDQLTFSGPTHSAGGGTVSVQPDGSYTYSPTAAQRHAASATGAPTTDIFTVTVHDGRGGTASKAVTVQISPANESPAGGSATGIATDITTGAVTGKITGVTDHDGDAPTYSAPTTSSGGGKVSVDPTTGAFTYTPTKAMRYRASVDNAPTSATQDSFTVTVSDGHGGTTIVPVSVAVDPGYRAGTVKRDPVTGDVAVKAAATTTAYDWVGFNPDTGSRGLTNTDVAGWDDVWIAGSSTGNLTTGQPTYAPGSIKVDPVTGNTAIRSSPDNLAGEWFVFNPTNGGYYASSAEVAQWVDVPATEAAAPVV